ncbi:hypothetical protein GPALN_010178 [Globodera pallida]|nr:hypothetical protein GPALN_010178 [Globodera pallida]
MATSPSTRERDQHIKTIFAIDMDRRIKGFNTSTMEERVKEMERIEQELSDQLERAIHLTKILMKLDETEKKISDKFFEKVSSSSLSPTNVAMPNRNANINPFRIPNRQPTTTSSSEQENKREGKARANTAHESGATRQDLSADRLTGRFKTLQQLRARLDNIENAKAKAKSSEKLKSSTFFRQQQPSLSTLSIDRPTKKAEALSEWKLLMESIVLNLGRLPKYANWTRALVKNEFNMLGATFNYVRDANKRPLKSPEEILECLQNAVVVYNEYKMSRMVPANTDHEQQDEADDGSATEYDDHESPKDQSNHESENAQISHESGSDQSQNESEKTQYTTIDQSDDESEKTQSIDQNDESEKTQSIDQSDESEKTQSIDQSDDESGKTQSIDQSDESEKTQSIDQSDDESGKTQSIDQSDDESEKTQSIDQDDESGKTQSIDQSDDESETTQYTAIDQSDDQFQYTTIDQSADESEKNQSIDQSGYESDLSQYTTTDQRDDESATTTDSESESEKTLNDDGYYSENTLTEDGTATASIISQLGKAYSDSELSNMRRDYQPTNKKLKKAHSSIALKKAYKI